MVTLYDHPLSPYAQKVRIALREKGIAFSSSPCRAAWGPAARPASSPRPTPAPRCRC